jgi:hypothetical protein
MHVTAPVVAERFIWKVTLQQKKYLFYKNIFIGFFPSVGAGL